MAVIGLGSEKGVVDTPYERFQHIISGLGQNVLERLEPREDTRATLAALAIAGDPTQSIEHISIVDLLRSQP